LQVIKIISSKIVLVLELELSGIAGPSAMANSEEESTRTTAIIDFKHTVLAKFKSDLPTQQLQQLIQGLEELCSHLDFVKSFEW
jgi:hypothetical protein